METRQSRMNKYYDTDVDLDDNLVSSSRTQRNQDLYKEVSSLELEHYDLNSNVSVIGENTDNINVDEIKDLLDQKYHENPRRKSFGDTDEIELPEINLDETREYDINAILEKAKEKKEVNYEQDRLKKIRSTQYDILKSLDMKNNEEEIEEEDVLDFGEKPTDRRPAPSDEAKEQELYDLIDTIAAKELIKNEKDLEISGEMDPLDILSDLRGDDENTKVMGALEQDALDELAEEADKVLEESNDIDDEKPILDEEFVEEKLDETQEESSEQNESIIQEEIKEKKTGDTKEVKNLKEIEKRAKKDAKKEAKKAEKEAKKKNLENSFIGKTDIFKQEDFDDFEDLKDNGKFGKFLVGLLVVIVVIAFIVGCVIMVNKFLGLGLF